MKFPTLSPNLKATIAIAFTTFLGALVTYIEGQLEGGIPPESQWRRIFVMALFTALGVTWHRLQPTPSQASSRLSERGFVSLRTLVVVLFVIGFAALANALIGCSKAQAANDVAIVLTDTQKACIAAEAASVASANAIVITDVEAACGITVGAEQLVQAFINDFFGQMKLAAARRAAARRGP